MWGLFALLIMSSLLGVSSTQWVMVWMCLEVNTLSMCFLLSSEPKEKKTGESSTFYYFLVQAMSSVLVLVGAMVGEGLVPQLVVVAMLMVKMGAWPFHLWYLKLISSLSIGGSMLVLMTWQKVMPVLLMSATGKSFVTELALLISLTTMAVAASQLKEKISFKSMLGLSSMNNNAWLVVAASISSGLVVLYLTVYSVALSLVVSNMGKTMKKNTWSPNKAWESTLAMANLGGLPPSSMFWVKVCTLSVMLETDSPWELMLSMMVAACYFLYLYLSYTTKESLNPLEKSQLMSAKSKSGWLVPSVGAISLASASLALMMLGLTSQGLSW